MDRRALPLGETAVLWYCPCGALFDSALRGEGKLRAWHPKAVGDLRHELGRVAAENRALRQTAYYDGRDKMFSLFQLLYVERRNRARCRLGETEVQELWRECREAVEAIPKPELSE